MNRVLFVCALVSCALLGACSNASKPVATPNPTPNVTTASETPSSTATPSTSKSAAPSQTAPPPDAIEACGTSDLKVNVSTDRSTYAQHQPVKISLVGRNSSSHACTTYGNSCIDSVNVTDKSGNLVWRSTKIGESCPAPQKRVLAPGAAQTYSFTWDQRPCTTKDCVSAQYVLTGDYTANGVWNIGPGDGPDMAATPAKFTIA